MDMSGQIAVQASLSPPQKESPIPISRMGEPQKWSGHGRKENNLCLCLELNSGCPAYSLLTTVTELPCIYNVLQ
jgi:hypothetical protein